MEALRSWIDPIYEQVWSQIARHVEKHPRLHLAAGLAALSLGTFYLYRKFHCHRVFKRLGIPGPEPHWLFGNSRQLLVEDRHLVIAEWTKQYGGVYGFYFGAMPVLVVSDLDAVTQVCIKQFESFQGHMLAPVMPQCDDPASPQWLYHLLLLSHGENWKRIRSIASPAFSSGKLRSYMPLLAEAQQDLMGLFDEQAKSGKSFEVREIFQLLTLQVITECGFGFDVNAIKTRGRGNFLLQNIRKFVHAATNPPSPVILTFIFTELVPLVRSVIIFQLGYLRGFFAPAGYIVKALKQVIAERRSAKVHRNDILQMMMDAVPEKDASLATNGKTPWKSLTETELVAQCMQVFVAGYETTSTSLSFLAYCLAANEKVQAKLYEEILSKVETLPSQTPGQKFPQFDYETLMNKMPYLDAVVHEMLRHFPVGFNVFNRWVVNDTTINGVAISKAVKLVQVDTWTIHRNKELWGDDADQFNPDRFLGEDQQSRPDAAFLGFGLGPRLCLGRRLALLEIKQTIVNMLLRYKITQPKDAARVFKISSKNGPLLPANGVHVKLTHR